MLSSRYCQVHRPIAIAIAICSTATWRNVEFLTCGDACNFRGFQNLVPPPAPPIASRFPHPLLSFAHFSLAHCLLLA
eukprot:scaffold7237_cov72-Cyclotella_meneghiniana.AAC.5